MKINTIDLLENPRFYTIEDENHRIVAGNRDAVPTLKVIFLLVFTSSVDGSNFDRNASDIREVLE
jgi:hypothetical protein